MKNTLVISLIVGVCIVGILMTISSTQGQMVNKPDTDDVPTLVKRGQSTNKEKDYSVEYKKLYPEQTKKLGEVADSAQANGIKSEVSISLGVPLIPTLGSLPTTEQVIKDLTCEADAVVLGKINNKVSHLTEDETWVYTSYEFLAEEVIKNNLISLIKAEDVIEITRPGGLIKLDNQVIRVKDRLYESLKINNRYLLFLKFVPTTQGYMVSSAKGDFILQGDKLKSLSKIGIFSKSKGTNDYLKTVKEIRKFDLSNCLEASKGGS